MAKRQQRSRIESVLSQALLVQSMVAEHTSVLKAMELGSEERVDLQEEALNSTYRRIFASYADDPVFLARLKESQRAWLKFRDAELKALFPHADKPGFYGDLDRARNIWHERLTGTRTLELSRWLQGTTADDPARASIKIAPLGN